MEQRKKKKMPVWAIVLIIIAVIGIVGSIVSSNSAESKDSAKETKSNEKKQEKFSYTVDSSAPDEYSMGYYINGTVTNNTDKNYDYVQIEFICYDADGNNLGTAIDNMNNLLANQTWKFKAMALSDVENIDHCEFKEITSW